MRILAFGEVMMRLMPPNYKLLTQSDTLEYLYTGTGVNVLSGLYQMGHKTFMATRLPDNNVGYAASAHLRKLGISDELISFGGEHLGMYFLEVGVGRRPSQVTYMNRRESSFGTSTVADYNISQMLDGVDYLHICGISLALNKHTRECAFNFAKEAKLRGIKIIFDCNFRPSLWNEEERRCAKEEYEKMLNISDIVFAGEKDAVLLLEIDVEKEFSGLEKTKFVLEKMRDKYGIEVILGTIRENIDNKQYLRGYLVDSKEFVLSEMYEVIVYDRVGAGDGFAAGAIHGLSSFYDKREIIDYAVCSGVLAHTTYGDSPMMTEKAIRRLMNNEFVDLIR